MRVLADWDMGEVELHAVFPRAQSCEAIRAVHSSTCLLQVPS